MLTVPDRFMTVYYDGSRFPGAPGGEDVEAGANCQQFAYELLRHFGLSVPDLRSSNLWEDTVHSLRVENLEPLDILFFTADGNAWGAHLGVYLGKGKVIHLSKPVGFPEICDLASFKDNPRHRILLGAKRFRKNKGIKEKVMDFYDVIKTRLSVRQYTQEPVEEEKLTRVLEAARIAPSAANRQPWRYIVVRDEETKKRLQPAYDKEWFYTAPVVIVALGDPATTWVRKDGRSYIDVDVTISFDHLVLAAAAEGLGTCWIANFDPKVVSEVLGIPPEYEPLLLTPLGYPGVTPQPRDRKPLEEIIYWDRWSEK